MVSGTSDSGTSSIDRLRRCQKLQQLRGSPRARRSPSISVAITFDAPAKLTTPADTSARSEWVCFGAFSNAASSSALTPPGSTRSKKSASWKRTGAVSGSRPITAAATISAGNSATMAE